MTDSRREVKGAKRANAQRSEKWPVKGDFLTYCVIPDPPDAGEIGNPGLRWIPTFVGMT